ncbi:hypothetical protein SAY86_005962 [Trapa natans]|uniref:Thioredoxin domain-containing protein n=1 Tax=Trapa natans TaxID=22666 RepID=A0AAN7L5P8_TRANT|nr:hypothetical protein SAY86_005962 [Trapa natans]
MLQRLNILNCRASFGLGNHHIEQFETRILSNVTTKFDVRSDFRAIFMMEKVHLANTNSRRIVGLGKIRCVADEGGGNRVDAEEEDDKDLCPVDCVKEFKTDEEFIRILTKAKETNALVVVDFYRTSCGSCKYIEQGFTKLCKRSGDQEAPVIFLKHNVIDEYDEESEVAERLRIRVFNILMPFNGVLRRIVTVCYSIVAGSTIISLLQERDPLGSFRDSRQGEDRPGHPQVHSPVFTSKLLTDRPAGRRLHFADGRSRLCRYYICFQLGRLNAC